MINQRQRKESALTGERYKFQQLRGLLVYLLEKGRGGEGRPGVDAAALIS